MTTRTPHPSLVLTDEVAQALRDGTPVVALESTIISHGMPHPQTVEMATEVERIIREDYADLVRQAKQFLSGETPSIQKNLAREMEEAAEKLEFERAAALRDRIRGLTHVQGRDRINIEGMGDADVVALHQLAGQTCVQVFFFRGGRNNGNRPFFLSHTKDQDTPEQVLGAFLAQLYDDLQAALRRAGVTPEVTTEARREADLLALVSAGAGVALVNSCQRYRPPQGVRFIPVTDLDVGLTLAYVHRPGHNLPLIARFSETLAALGGGAPVVQR